MVQTFLVQTEKQIGISITVMLTLEQKLCCKLKEKNTKPKEYITRQHVNKLEISVSLVNLLCLTQ